MRESTIYLDNNATTRMDPAVAERMFELDQMGIANPASQHRAGRHALRLLEAAKSSLLRSLGAAQEGMDSAQVILTSGGTEANNLALHSYTYQREGLVIVGAAEHSSILQAAELSAICLNPVRRLPMLSGGHYDLSQLAEWLEAIYGGRDQHSRVALVSLMFANNETGVINDLAQVVKLCKQYQIPVHSDIVQAVGKVDFDMDSLGLSSVTVAAHKIHGPVGIGALIVQSETPARPMLVGGGQQLGWRAGTEPVVLAVGMARALELAEEARRQGSYQQVADLRDSLEAQLIERLEGIEPNGDPQRRVPQTSNLSFAGLDRQALQMALDLAGVACSTGSACSSGSSRPSTTLTAMGLSEPRIASALRLSLSRFTTQDEISRAVDILVSVVQKQRRLGDVTSVH